MTTKRRILISAALLAAFTLLCGCAGAAFTPDGVVTVRTADKDAHEYRIAEVMLDENGSLNVYIRGTDKGMVCSYAFQGGGFGWSVYVSAAVLMADGTRLVPAEITPYMNGDNGAVGFHFDTGELPASIVVFAEDNPDGAVTVPYADLTLDEEYWVSPTIVELAP